MNKTKAHLKTIAYIREGEILIRTKVEVFIKSYRSKRHVGKHELVMDVLSWRLGARIYCH